MVKVYRSKIYAANMLTYVKSISAIALSMLMLYKITCPFLSSHFRT